MLRPTRPFGFAVAAVVDVKGRGKIEQLAPFGFSVAAVVDIKGRGKIEQFALS